MKNPTREWRGAITACAISLAACLSSLIRGDSKTERCAMRPMGRTYAALMPALLGFEIIDWRYAQSLAHVVGL